MYLREGLALVGSGHNGFGMSHRYDCHIYLLKGERESLLIDTGAGVDIESVIGHLDHEVGADLDRVRTILVTHAHADHAGGAGAMRERLSASLLASSQVAHILRNGDDERAGVPVGKRGGAYSADYSLTPTSVDGELSEGLILDLGGVTVECVETPGHSVGHMAFVARWHDHTALFTGDALLFGGRIVLQDTWDCDLRKQLESLHRLENVAFEGLYPGHFSFSLNDGRRHLDQALDRIRRGGIPEAL